MRSLSRLLVLVAVLCAVGYTFHRVRTCTVTGLAQHDVQSVATRTVVAPGDTVLAYPSPSVTHALKLGYDIFTTDPDGSMVALPLPPGAALQTTLILPVAGHRRLLLNMANAKCGYGVDVQAFRPDQLEPLLQSQLAAHGKSPPQIVDVTKVGPERLLVVSIKLADGAKNNWFCNIALNWDDKR